MLNGFGPVVIFKLAIGLLELADVLLELGELLLELLLVSWRHTWTGDGCCRSLNWLTAYLCDIFTSCWFTSALLKAQYY